MNNDPELQKQGKYLGTITKDFAIVAETIKESAYAILKKGFEYPIFPICKESMSLGQLLIAKGEIGLEWNYYVSYLEEFKQRKLITEDNLEDFKKTYKDPDEFCCLFVVDIHLMGFVFVPYPED